MPTPTHEPAQSFTVAQIEEWIGTSRTRATQLYSQALEPLYSTQREAAVHELVALLQEALEKVRAVSASLREERKAIRAHASALLVRSVLIRERSKRP